MTSRATECSCPRCGYDQSGIVDSWKESCPLDGVCSECGLEFRWRSVLDPELRNDRLFYETATNRRVRAFRVTGFRMHRPWKFWSWVAMHYPLNARRMILSTVLTAFMIWLCGSLLLIGSNLLVYTTNRSTIQATHFLSQSNGTWSELVWFSLLPNYGWYRSAPYVVTTAAFACWMLLMPLSYLILGDTLSKAKARWSHVVRISCYQFVALSWYWLINLLIIQVVYWPMYINLSYRFRYMSVPKGVTIAANASGYVISYSPFLLLGIPVTWIVLWWGFAGKRYLKIRHPWWVAIVMTVTTGIAVFAGLLYYGLATHRI